MKGLRYFIVITKREFAEAYLDFFAEHGVHCVFATQCVGSADDRILEYMALENSEKIMFSAFIPVDKLADIKKGLVGELRLCDHGNGIAFTVPADGIGGKTALQYLTGGASLPEEDQMENFGYSLIVTIVNQGFADAVMDAARAVNARGGTILKAKGTGAGYTEKFFGVSITEEKEMVYIVAKREDRDAIMRAIMERAGAGTEARSAVFALPVDSVEGVRSLSSEK